MKSTNLLRVCAVLALAMFAVSIADTADAGLFGRLRGGDCCCEPAPTCCDNGGFLSGMRDRFAGDDCCCEPAPCCEPACPCEVEPACPCEAAPVVEDCGCAAAPVVEDCGCVEAAPCCEAEPCCCDDGVELGGKLKCKLGGLRDRFSTDCGCGC